MPWDMGQLEERALLDDFDAECVEAGFVEGYIPAEKTRSGKPVVSHQLLLVWRPLEDEAKDQPSWYSMGGKEFAFGGKVKTIELGDKTFELYPEVVEGPKLAKNSRMGLLVERLRELGVQPEGGSADWFIGLKAHLRREKYEAAGRSTLEVERETLMPTEILGRAEAKAAAPAVTEEETDEILIAAVVGHTDADVPRLERVKALGLSPAKVFKKLDALVKEGRLVKKNGTYEEA
jgi:hypothetical protein